MDEDGARTTTREPDEFAAMMEGLDALRTRPAPSLTERELEMAWLLVCLLAMA